MLSNFIEWFVSNIGYYSKSILFWTFPNVLEHIWILTNTSGRTCIKQQPSIRYNAIIMLCQFNMNLTHSCVSSSSRSSATCSTVATLLNWYFGVVVRQMTRHMTTIALCINSSSVNTRNRSPITIYLLQESHSTFTGVVTTITIFTSIVMAATTTSLYLSLF